ncbi:MAG TPA: hypothetical protein ENK98_07045 [Epsilonproteobacteria bacterium]|nr:hypothetical protein [Campylobacterota bacterium]
MKKQHFLFIVGLYVLAVFYLATTTPISPHEAYIYFSSHDIVSTFMHWGERLIGGFLGLRIFFIFFGFLSLFLYYKLSRQYFIRESDAYLSTLIFMLLPGILTGMSLANTAIIALSLVLLFVLLYENNQRIFLPFIMLALFFIDESSIIFFLALLLYGVIYKDKKLAIGSLAFLLAFIYLAKGIAIGGRPSGHFIEIFGLYATVFSPLLFLYFFYAMYRILLRGKKNLLWYISFTALAFSLLLSLRQRVHITDFAPYVMISVVLMLDIFNHSVRVRLPEFQKQYKRGFYIVMGLLLVSASLIIFHRALYYVIDNPSKHFANRIYKPYWLAKKLKSKGLRCYDDARGREAYQLRYYNILSCSK